MTKAERNTAAHQAELAIDPLRTQLAALHLSYVLQQYEALATEAAHSTGRTSTIWPT